MDIISEINKLKKERNAIILAHYYTEDSVQAIADYTGDSLYLSQIAATTTADTIIFCGVYFMGESAKLLNPNKTVIMAENSADCPMAHMVDVEEINKIRDKYEDLSVVCYVNSTAEIKALSDICVTSANAVSIVERLSSKNIFFIPDRNLGTYVKTQVKNKNIILNEGFCPIHDAISVKDVKDLKKLYPNAEVLVHPECKKDVIQEGNFTGSTKGILKYVNNSNNKDFIICTEKGINYELTKQNPEKNFYFPNYQQCCKDMKKISLEHIKRALQDMCPVVTLTSDIMEKANIPLKRMLEMSK